jgi:hypothetical protein
MIVAAGLLLASVPTYDYNIMMFGLGFLLIGIILGIAQWISASHARCPLCSTPVLAPMGCTKHRRAKSLLGSYRLRVAFAITFIDRFRCPYCNEPTTMEVGERLESCRSKTHEY